MTFPNLCIFSLSVILFILASTYGCKDSGTELPLAPVITQVDPDSGAAGDQIKVEGSNFGNSRDGSEVRFGSVAAGQYDQWAGNEIRVRVPSGAQTGAVTVRTAGGTSNGVSFRVLGGGGGVSFSTQIQPIFTTNCVGAGCHPGGGAPFSLEAGQSYGNLVNVPATNGVCAGNLMRVRPSLPDSSALVKRIEGTTCGFRMPFNGPPFLSTGDQTLIRDWISQGAQNN